MLLLGHPLWRPRETLITFFDQKKLYKFVSLIFFSPIFGHQNPGSGYLDPDSLEMLDPDSINPDSQLCIKLKQNNC